MAKMAHNKHLLFNPSEFNFFKCSDGKEFQLEEYDVFVIASSSSMVGPSEQGIRLSHRLSRVMVESEVKMSKVRRPASLMIVELLCCHKVDCGSQRYAFVLHYNTTLLNLV